MAELVPLFNMEALEFFLEFVRHFRGGNRDGTGDVHLSIVLVLVVVTDGLVSLGRLDAESVI